MNCWKSINVKKEYNTFRLLLLSILSMILSFIFSYLIFSLSHPGIVFAEIGMANTILFFLLLFPLHLVLDTIPLWLAGVRMKLRRHQPNKSKILVVTMESKKPIGRNMYMLAVLFPTFFVGILSVWGALLFPSYAHLFIVLFSFNMGLSVYDFVYVKPLFSAPKHSYIEQKQNGLDILLKQPM
ncbi:DUF3267 domain-containing protein [Alteribacillus iranensis]|uniref:Putative zincin peptidase n=1 Tax=Alteribacillus iranensis TaxID=930128 RepID=A0A1I1Z451_9BACI|nr:DUF3267 domain-containing protein [Alteribacillus iranensis]SFE26531.1 Putative zincin peptidase [Alteribacillus iranensis]